MSCNFWFEHIIDAYLLAVAQGRDWQAACAEAEQIEKNRELRLLDHKGLRAKGIPYSRQHIARRVAAKTFPPPFNLPSALTQEAVA